MTIALPDTPTDPSFRTWLQYARDRALTTWVHYRVAEPAAHVVYLRRLASGALYARRVAGGAIQLVYSIREFLRVAWSGGFRCAAA